MPRVPQRLRRLNEPMFAKYAPKPTSRPQIPFEVRPARSADLPAMVKLSGERPGTGDSDAKSIFASMKQRLAHTPDEGQLFVAVGTDNRLLGCGSSAFLRFEDTHQHANLVPSGWYLTGLMVTAKARRAGIGRALTTARMVDRIAAQETLRFVANVQNEASRDLHLALGFKLETDEFHMPGVTFRGGEGLLFRFGS